MKKGHIPDRTCVGCRKKRPKSEMTSFTACGVDSGDRHGEGRGMYVCPDAVCMEKILTRTDIKKRLGPSAYAKVVQGLETVTTKENCLDGSSPGCVICDEYYGGVAFG